MTCRLAIFVLTLCLAVPAWAEGGHGGKAEKKPEPGTSVEMPFLVAPMAQDGNLLGYSYISSRLVCSSPSACIDVRQKLAFIQDAFVRDVNARPIAQTANPKDVNKELLNSRLTAAAKRIVGNSKVKGMLFLEIKFMPLHPADSTANVAPPEQAPAEGADEAGKKKAENGDSEGATSKPATGPAH